MFRVPQHWTVCALCSLAFAIISYKNTCYSEISSVVDSFTQERISVTTEFETCPIISLDTHGRTWILPFPLPDVYWNPWILVVAEGAFQTGKLLSTVPAGVLSDLGYSKYVLGGGMMLVAVKHLVHPSLVEYGVTAFAVDNFFEGVGDAAVYPSVISLMSRWTPPSERNFFVALVVAGTYYGDTLGYAFFHLVYVGFSSWSVGQYTTGVVGLVWLILCVVFVHDSPKDSSMSPNTRRRSSMVARLHRLHGIPWRKIVSSPPFLSLVLAFTSIDWATTLNVFANFGDYQVLILNLPDDFSNHSTIGMIAILPASLMAGFLADWIVKHDVMSKTSVKKTFTFIGVLLSSLLLVSACCLVGCNVLLFWVLSISGVYVIGLAVPTMYSAPIDLSARNAGLLTGIMTGVRTIFSLFTNRIDQYLVTEVFDPTQWRIRSIICGVLTVTMILPFLFLGSLEKQSWMGRRLGALQENPPNDQARVENLLLPGSRTVEETTPRS